MGVICKYKFDSSIYADFIPEFNNGYSGYTITDEVEGNIITRTIESESLPTLMRFGSNLDTYVEGSEVALLEVLEMNTSGLTSCYRMFRYCKNLTSISCEWNTSNVNDTGAMFQNCFKLTTLDVSNWNTSNVTAMGSMFQNCFNLTTLDVSNFNTSKVTNMTNMFQYCSKLTSLDVSSFNTSKVTNMSHMFNNCSSITSLDVSGFDTSNVTNMKNIFSNCNNLISLDVSNFNTSKVTDMAYMFYNCNNLTSLDLSNFDTSNVTNMQSMFNNCNNLTSLDVSVFKTIKVAYMVAMFANCASLTSLDLSNFNTSKVTNATDMFTNTNSLEVITMFNNDINTINVVGNLTSATIYVNESLDQSQYTGTAPLKVYKEEKLEIKLNSPLLEEDTIEVVDGKLCHVHRMGKVVLDGSEDEKWSKDANLPVFKYNVDKDSNGAYLLAFCDNFLYIASTIGTLNFNCFKFQAGFLQFRHISYDTLDTFKQWLQANPTTVVYELAKPYYEDITPLQSSIILKTFLESSMTIDTNLPIETKLSYRTNVPSISTLSTRATELAESDNVIHNLMNIIDDEVDE